MNAWDTNLVLQEYRYGIHWELLRRILKGKCGHLTPKETRILHVVSAGGFWPEQRRYQCGISDSELCTACRLEAGTAQHRIHDCPATEADKMLRIAAGEATQLPPEARRPKLAPLVEMGLPPQLLDWTREEVELEVGHMSHHTDGRLHGDGSGFEKKTRRSCRNASKLLVRLS